MKLEPHKKAGLVESLAVDHFALHGRSLVDGGDFDLISWLPVMRGADTNTLGTEIISVGFFFDFAAIRRDCGKAHHDHDREPLFRSSGQMFVKIHTHTCCANDLAAKADGF